MCGACVDIGHQLERSQQQQQRNIIVGVEARGRGSDQDNIDMSRSSAADNMISSASLSSSHHRSFTSPTPCTRRIIFPSLYEGSMSFSQQQQQQLLQQQSCHGKERQPATVGDSSISLAHTRANSLDGISIPLPKFPPGSVAGSCSGGRDAKPTPPPPILLSPSPLNNNYLNPKPTAQDPPPQSRCAAQAQDPPLSCTTTTAPALDITIAPRPRSRSVILGDVLRHRTYYPAATVPTPVGKSNKSSSTSKPLTSILRRRVPLITPPPPPTSPQPVSSTTSTISRRASAPTIPTCSLPKLSPPTQPLSKSLTLPRSPILSPTVPTLASPASIISLHSHHGCSDHHHTHNHDGISSSSNIGESECDLVRITDFPKLLPRSQQCTLRKIQSDTIVTTSMEEDVRRLSRRELVEAGAVAATNNKAASCHEKTNNENGTRGSHNGSLNASCVVSRHASLESLGTNKRVSFDPHITVYEFGIADYEKRGGEKWWSENELAKFKQEAIQRIRLRSTKVIPTGTGRALAVSTKKGGEATTTTTMMIPSPSPAQVVASSFTVGRDAAQQSPASAASATSKKPGWISFNHPALSCCEDELFESECKKSSSSSSLRECSSRLHCCLTQEIRNILVVDPHEIFLALFTKSLRFMLPHASVATARSAEEALTRIRAAQCAFPQSDGGSIHGFDIIIIEEKLVLVPSQLSTCSSGSSSANSKQQSVSTQPAGDDSIQRRCNISSGSALIRHLIESEQYCPSSDNTRAGSTSEIRSRFSLLVGVSAHFSEHREKLDKAGADCVWGKPPPEMNCALRNELLKTLMKKRKKYADLEMLDL